MCENEKVRLDCAGAYGLHVSPSLGALRVTTKLKKESYLFQNCSFSANYTNIFKKELQKVSKRVSLFPGWRLLGHLWSSKLILDSKNEPQKPPDCSQSDPDVAEYTPKGRPKW